MTDVLDVQVYALLSRLHAEQDAGCRKLRETASEQAARLVAEARRRARARVKEAVLQKRQRVEEHCRRVRVELESKQRDRSFHEMSDLLARGLDSLPRVLAERWRDAGARDKWCEQVLAGAAAALRPGAWQLTVAPGLAAERLQALSEAASALAGAPAEVREDPALAAGLRIVHEGACYDGTVAGLLSDRTRVQAGLLAELGHKEAKP
jgi:aryl carrier-like protein